MAISSIQMFQNNGGNSIEGLLRAGPEAISNIMNQAISLGRSMADKQLAQERDMLNMRQQENALAQRRGEQAQNIFADTMKFNRAVGEDNRDFAANREDAAFQRSRLTANDAFSREMEMRRLGLSEKKLGLMQSEAEAERQRKAEELLRFNEQYGGGEPSLPGAGGLTPNPEILANEKLARDEANMIGARSLFGVKDEAADTRSKNIIADVTDQNPRLSEFAPTSAGRMFTPEEDGMVLPPREDLASVEAKLDMLENPPEGASEKALTKFYEEKSLLEQRKKELSKKPETIKAPTAAAEEKQVLRLFDNKIFFPPPVGKNPTPEQIKEAKIYEKDKVSNELTSASRMKENEYVEKVPNLNEAGKAARRRVWQYAQKEFGISTPTTTGTGAVSRIPGI